MPTLLADLLDAVTLPVLAALISGWCLFLFLLILYLLSPMSAKKPVRPPLSEDALHQHERDQARERRRRGLTDFTRPGRKEEVYNRTPGRSKADRARGK